MNVLRFIVAKLSGMKLLDIAYERLVKNIPDTEIPIALTLITHDHDGTYIGTTITLQDGHIERAIIPDLDALALDSTPHVIRTTAPDTIEEIEGTST